MLVGASAAGTGGPHRKPLIEAFSMVPVQTSQHTQGVTQLEVLEADCAFLPSVE